MQVLDWGALARGALWIAGLSIVLAAWSYAYWQAREERIRLRDVLARPAFQLAFNGGLALFTGGLAWGSSVLWERLAGLAVALVFAWLAASAGRLLHRESR